MKEPLRGGNQWEKARFPGHLLEVDVGSVAPSWLTLPSSFLELSSFLYHTLSPTMLCVVTNGINYAVLELGGNRKMLFLNCFVLVMAKTG